MTQLYAAFRAQVLGAESPGSGTVLNSSLLAIAVAVALCVAFHTATAFASGNSSDTINERIPSTMEQRESHWKIDCSALTAKLADKLYARDCASVTELRKLRLCAYLYQPPGSTAISQCPDFNLVYAVISKQKIPDCGLPETQRRQVAAALNCNQAVVSSSTARPDGE